MRIQNTNISIAEIREMFERKDLVVNNEYQRNSNFWPNNAKSYFIDTILNGYPFPKVYFYESLLSETKKIRREIVDGQQRIQTIMDFLNDKFALTRASLKYSGKHFSEMAEEDQISFLSYSVPVDMILSAERNQILEMFRRMNSYTQPLNAAEKRHSDFAGEFKWFINELADEYSPMLVNFGVLTNKQVVRMADSELLTEICQIEINGIVNKSDSTLKKLYETNDKRFIKKDECDQNVREVLSFVRENLGDCARTFLFKSYVLYSLCAALIYSRWGIHKWDEALPASAGRFWKNPETAKTGLRALSSAHETQDTKGPFAEYVEACMSTTHRVAQRRTRAKWLLKALNCDLDNL